ncbi:hypothetical protein DINM_000141 [Dirofilaria immitis]|nr:hypothetical protein [Dirofilaria immitis]
MADLQKHLQVLRQRLDDSIRLYYYRQKQAETNRSSNGGRSIISDIMKNRRILHMLHQDETNACIQISDHSSPCLDNEKKKETFDALELKSDINLALIVFPEDISGNYKGNMAKETCTAIIVSKISNNNSEILEKMDTVIMSTISPLQVIVSSGSQQPQSIPKTINFISGSNSPVGSIDSGMSSLSSLNSSPASSPECSPVSLNSAPFQYGKYNVLVDYNSRTASDTTRPFNKRKHKCNSWSQKHSEKILSNTHHCRTFLRSFSECQDREDEEVKLIIASMNNENSAGCTLRKKRVSFSERLVQERSFRPNSSILSQKKKNQRKQKNKMKKKALAIEDSSTDDEARHQSNSEMMHCSVCNDNEDDETDPIECDLAACVLEDPMVIELDGNADYGESTKNHKHILRIVSD